MTRLADYFAVVGYDHNRGRNGVRGGKILQRFPERDWPDTPFIDGLELFCQPQGWSLSCERQEPQFFVCVLTDFNASRHYCAVLGFNEPHAITPTQHHADEEEDGLEVTGNGSGSTGVGGNGNVVLAGGHHSIMYAPRCLVLVSTLDCLQTFRNCLGLVYTVHIEGLNVSLETLVGNMVGYVQVPPPGGPQVRFSIGAGDRQALQPPSSPTLPVTNTTVLGLFSQLGIRNVLVLFCAAVTENKLLFHSVSYTRLTDGCHALKALIYPFHYRHVYIPILPAPLVEVLSTPTPFIMGVHSSLKNDVSQLMDVIVVDLDGGSIRVPDSLALSLLTEPHWSEAQNALSHVLHADLSTSDNAFSSSTPPLATPHVLKDKQVRAVFMRLFARLLQGYRSCLTLIRIHSSPVLTFHKAAFLGQRGFHDHEFVSKLLDCMSFTEFVNDRGLPWRVCDLWDELYSQTPEQQRLEHQDPRLVLVHIKELGHQLYNNENPNPQFESKIPKPTEGSFTRIHQPVFPKLDASKIQAIIEEGTSKEVKIPKSKDQPKIVPMGPHISSLPTIGIGGSSAQRLKVLRDCVSCIFESKISDARKTFPAVLRALKTKAARLALCSELALHVQRNKAVLEHEQFDLIVRLMNCALQDASQMDEHGVAAALLPLSTAFCCKLCTGVMQFAFTCIQEHPVWSNLQFWEAAFYQDVQKDIRTLYLDQVNDLNNHFGSLFSSGRQNETLDLVNFKERRPSYYPTAEQVSALDIAAERLRVWPSLAAAKQRELNEQEESTLYSQAIHYAYRMVYLRIPLDINTSIHRRPPPDNSSFNFNNSMAESDSMDAESGFEDQEQSDRESSVIRFVSRFVDAVCTEGKVTDDHVKSLHQMIPGVVAMHIETLDMVYKESRRLPPTQKHKIMLPSLIPGEKMEVEGLRVHLLPDGREDGVSVKGGPVLLPAEGALFLTNYRIIFKGLPTDPYACEQVVVRAMPLCSITREKRVSGGQHHGLIDQWTTDGMQIRSATFQLLRFAFDEEVSNEAIESLRKLLTRLRHPPSVLQVFAFTGHSQVVCPPSRREKDKQGYGTLRGFAKKTLLKTAKVAGLKSGKGRKQDKYVFPSGSGGDRRGIMTKGGTTMMPGSNGSGSTGGGMAASRGSLFPSNSSLMSHSFHPGSRVTMTLPQQQRGLDSSTDDLHHHHHHMHDLDEAAGSELDAGGGTMTSSRSGEFDNKTLEKVTERSYYRDYQRLGLAGLLPLTAAQASAVPSMAAHTTGKKTDFRITAANSTYQLCRSYPAVLSVPNVLSDECIGRVSRVYRNGRFPVATWRHPSTRALLLRGAGVHSRNALTKLSRGPAVGQQLQGSISAGGAGGNAGMGVSTSSSDGSSHSVEHEKFLSAIVAATPLVNLRQGSLFRLGGSSLSINSLVHSSAHLPHHMQPLNLAHGSSSASGLMNGGSSAASNVDLNNASLLPSMQYNETGVGGTAHHSPSHAAAGADASSLNYSTTASHHSPMYNSQLNSTYNSSFPAGSPYGGGGSSPSYFQSVVTPAGGVAEYPSAVTPEISRRTNPLTKAINTLSVEHGAAVGVGGGRLSTVMMDTGSVAAGATATTIVTSGSSAADANTEVVRAFNTAALYIFGEKTHLKGLKTDVVHKTEFIIVDYPDVWQVKSSFKKLMRACIPSTSTVDQEQSFYRLVENSEWLVQLSRLLQCSGAVVDLTDLLGASVMLLLEDGWDFTAQVSSLAQVCLDPYYRTIEGFRVLVEKEWLAYGHRFLHRGNVLHSSQSAGFAPIFLQFLDAVHQIQRQFPLSFEFNEYYLRFLAYHSVSGRFRTFLSDCELERVELGIMSEEDKRGSLSRHHKGLEATQEDDIYPTGGGRLGSPTSSSGNSLGQSVFDYIDKLAARSPVFYNFLYAPDRAYDSQQVLRPVSAVSGLSVWEYLVGEELRHGPPYEPEVRQHDNMREEEEAAADGGGGRSSVRRVMSRGYDCLMASQPDVFTAQLEELRQLEQELGHLPHKWSVHWDKLELPQHDLLQRQASVSTQVVREHGESVHKRNTLELLVRAKTLTALTAHTPPAAAAVAGGPAGAHLHHHQHHNHSHHHHDAQHTPGYTHPHRFDKYNYATPAYCDHCSSVLWGPIKTGLRCVDCGYNCHEKCMESVSNSCTRYKGGKDPSTVHHPPPPQQLDTASIASGVTSQKPSQQTYDDYSSNVPENRTHEGYLWKRGSLLKNWKQRWFVLDSVKHQLRYYDNNDDPNAKGVIEMSEVVAVCPATPTPGAPKKIDEKAFFDLQTRKRVYNFCAADGAAAQEWIEKIQACLQ
uniref:Myotubularin-related protein 13-like n=6 Tax=Hirondellea gigas TaxID=1518452 RepID=A0A6A7FYR4_9CRUS